VKEGQETAKCSPAEDNINKKYLNFEGHTLDGLQCSLYLEAIN